MELLEQCQIWHDNDEFEKIISAIEAIPEADRTPALDMELARAYNNRIANSFTEEREYYRKALALLMPLENYYKEDTLWYTRVGYALFFLRDVKRALPYFERAFELCPENEGSKDFVDNCNYVIDSGFYEDTTEIPPYDPDNSAPFFEKIAEIKEQEENLRCVIILENTMEKYPCYEIILSLADSLIRYAKNGSRGIITSETEYTSSLKKAKQLLLSIEDEGKSDSEWYLSMYEVHKGLWENERAYYYLTMLKENLPDFYNEEYNNYIDDITNSVFFRMDFFLNGRVNVDRIKTAFDDLYKKGIIAFPLISVPGIDGREECISEAEFRRDSGENIEGYCFFTTNDANNVILNNDSLYITFGSIGYEDDLTIGEEVYNTLAQNGHIVMWDHKKNSRIAIVTGMDKKDPSTIAYDEDNKEAFFDKIEQWTENDKHLSCIYSLFSIPAEQRDYRINYLIARSLENYAIVGEGSAGTPANMAEEALTHAIRILLCDIEMGENRPEWNMRMAYGFRYLYGNEMKAIPYAKRWQELEPDNKEALNLIQECMDAKRENEELSGYQNEEYDPELYAAEEIDAIEEHIKEYFGDFDNVFHEQVSPDIHVDIVIVPPTKERNFYTLVTIGMGAHKMDTPPQLDEYDLERAELLLTLPPYWKFGRDALKSETWYWPMRLLKDLARFPIANKTWLGLGHSMDNQNRYASNTKLCGALFVSPQKVPEGSEVCLLPNGDDVNFYQLIPLYRNEMEYKIKHGSDELIALMGHVDHVIDPHRKSIFPDENESDNIDLPVLYEPGDKAQTEAATRDMEKWLSHPAELGEKPFDMVFVGAIDYIGYTYYIFKYKKDRADVWRIGISGGYEKGICEHCGHTFSDFEEFIPGQQVRMAMELVDTIVELWQTKDEGRTSPYKLSSDDDE